MEFGKIKLEINDSLIIFFAENLFMQMEEKTQQNDST